MHNNQSESLPKMVLERFNMYNAKIAPTPILLDYVSQENKGAVDPVWHQKFQSVIGSLLYLMLGMLWVSPSQ